MKCEGRHTCRLSDACSTASFPAGLQPDHQVHAACWRDGTLCRSQTSRWVPAVLLQLQTAAAESLGVTWPRGRSAAESSNQSRADGFLQLL